MNLLFADKVWQAFVDEVISAASQLPATEPDWWMFDMFNESSLDPTAINSIGCVGLFQFCPDHPGGDYKTIGGVQHKLSDIRDMSAIDQIRLGLQYFKDVQAVHGRFASYYDLLLADFYPAAIGQPDTYVFPQDVVDANKGLFTTGNTMADYKKGRDARVRQIVPTAYYDTFFKKKTFLQLYKREIFFWGSIIGLIIVLYFIYKSI